MYVCMYVCMYVYIYIYIYQACMGACMLQVFELCMEFFPYLRLLARVLHGIWRDSGTKMADHIVFKRVFPDQEEQQGWWMYFLHHQGYYVVADKVVQDGQWDGTQVLCRILQGHNSNLPLGKCYSPWNIEHPSTLVPLWCQGLCGCLREEMGSFCREAWSGEAEKDAHIQQCELHIKDLQLQAGLEFFLLAWLHVLLHLCFPARSPT